MYVWMYAYVFVCLRVCSQASTHLGAPAFSSTVDRCLGQAQLSEPHSRHPALTKRIRKDENILRLTGPTPESPEPGHFAGCSRPPLQRRGAPSGGPAGGAGFLHRVPKQTGSLLTAIRISGDSWILGNLGRPTAEQRLHLHREALDHLQDLAAAG